MTLYDGLLFLHIGGAIAWLGGGVMLTAILSQPARTRDDEKLGRVVQDTDWVATAVFIPASFTVLITGLLLVIDGPWSFGELWVVLALCGYAATTAAGILVFKPWGERVEAMVERDGMTPAAATETRRMLTAAGADLVGLWLVVAIMVIKPTGDDVAVLVAMAAILGAAIGYFGTRAARMGGATRAEARTSTA